MKRRKKHRCVHLRVSQEVIFDHWKPCNKPKTDTNNVNDTKVHEHPNAESENVQILHETEQEIANTNTLKSEEKDIENGGKADLELCSNKVDLGSKRLPKSVRICEEPRVDYNSPRSSKKSDQTVPQCVNQPNISKEAANSKYISEDIFEAQRKSSSCKSKKTDKYSLRKTSFKKRSQSDTSLSERVITDNSMDSSLYCKVHTKRAPSVKEKVSREFKFNTKNTRNVNLCQQSNVDKTEDVFDNASPFSSRQKQKCETKHFANKYRYHWKNNCTITDRQNDDTSQKKIRHCARNCSCSVKERDHSSPQQWSTNRKESSSKLYHHSRCKIFTNLQKNDCLCEHMRAKKNIHSVAETRPSRYKVQSMHCKEKPTWIIFKNKRSGRSRILEETKFDNSTYSPYSSSTIFTDITENLPQDDSATWYPHYKHSRYVSSTNPRKYNKCNTSIDPNGLTSSSCLSSPRQCHSWAMLSQNSVYHEQQPISSSSCTNIPRWKRRYSKHDERTRTYHSSTSSCSLTSLSTYRDDYNLENSYTNRITYNALKKNKIFYEGVDDDEKLKQTQRSWRRPRCREQEKRTIHMNERHVAWDI